MLGRSRGRRVTDETVLVVGLGLFGSAAARELAQMQVPLIAVTEDHEQAVRYADEFDHVVVNDDLGRAVDDLVSLLGL